MQKKLKRFVRVHDIHGNEVELPYFNETADRVKCNFSITKPTKTEIEELKSNFGLTLGEVVDWAVCNLYETLKEFGELSDSDGKEESDNGAEE